jgi:hypothetical protein
MADLKEQSIIKSYFTLEKEFLRFVKCVKKKPFMVTSSLYTNPEWYFFYFKVVRLRLKTLYAEDTHHEDGWMKTWKCMKSSIWTYFI